MNLRLNRRVVVLDDDPTGTQGVSGLPIVLHPDASTLEKVSRDWAGPIWVLTNTRAMTSSDAVSTIETIASTIRSTLGKDVQLVLRGDSTLRGHVLAEIDALSVPNSVALFVPAFLEEGRITSDGVHYAEIAGRRVPVALTEYARDHEFAYTHSRLTEWIAEREPGRVAIPVNGDILRAANGVQALREILLSAPEGAIVLPDAETPEDLATIAAAWESITARQVVVRCAASLASVITRSRAQPVELPAAHGPVLVICASYTNGARDQLTALANEFQPTEVELNITEALGGSERAAAHAEYLAHALTEALLTEELVVLSTPRSTAAEHLTLAAGQAMMDVVIGAVRGLGVVPSLVITKGGITGARVARDGFSAATATVLGQPFRGVPLWLLDLPDGSRLEQLVVPGNVGAPSLIADAVRRTLPNLARLQ